MTIGDAAQFDYQAWRPRLRKTYLSDRFAAHVQAKFHQNYTEVPLDSHQSFTTTLQKFHDTGYRYQYFHPDL